MALTNAKGTCIRCGKEALTKCGACANPDLPRIALLQHANTWYCSSDCQKANWPKHRLFCLRNNDSKKFYRVVHILNSLFVHCQSLSVVPEFEAVDESTPGKIYLRYNEQPDLPMRGGRPAMGTGLNKELFLHSESIRAVETHQASHVPLADMYPISKVLFSELTADLQEVAIIPANNKLDIIYTDHLGIKLPSKNEHIHRVLKVTFTRGPSYYVDLTAPQFGYSQVAGPWDEFLLQRVQNRESLICEPRGAEFRRYIKENFDLTGPRMDQFGNQEFFRRSVSSGNYLHAYEELKKWQRQHRMSVANLLSLSDKEFGKEVKDLVGSMLAAADAGYNKVRQATHEIVRGVRGPSMAERFGKDSYFAMNSSGMID